jgi:hypothetical protein
VHAVASVIGLCCCGSRLTGYPAAFDVKPSVEAILGYSPEEVQPPASVLLGLYNTYRQSRHVPTPIVMLCGHTSPPKPTSSEDDDEISSEIEHHLSLIPSMG